MVVNREFDGNAASFVLSATDVKTKRKTSSVVTVTKTSDKMKKIEIRGQAPVVVDLGEIDAKSSSPLATLRTNQDPSVGISFSMSRNPYLRIDSYTGAVDSTAAASPGHLKMPPKDVIVTAKRLSDMQQASVVIKISKEGAAAWKPLTNQFSFSEDAFTSSLSVDAPVGTKVQMCESSSFDASVSPHVKIISGNYFGEFKFDPEAMSLVLQRKIKMSGQKKMKHHVVLVATSDDGLFSLCTVNIHLEKAAPSSDKSSTGIRVFPLGSFVSSVPENVPPGSRVRGPPIKSGAPAASFWSNSDLFSVDPHSGEIVTLTSLDYESSPSHGLTIFANSSGLVSECSLEILVESRDEFAPVFDRPHYYFVPKASSGVPKKGDQLGRVRARDRDQGPDGRVVYTLAVGPGGGGGKSKYFSVDSESGAVTVIKDLDTGVFEEENQGGGVKRRRKRDLRDVQIVVRARSRQPDSLEATVLVSVSLVEALLPSAVGAGAMAGWVQGMLVGIVLLLIVLVLAVVFICRKKRREEEERKNNLLASGGIVNPNMSMEMTSSSDALSRFPPQYSEIVSEYGRTKDGKQHHHHGGLAGVLASAGNNPRSEISEKSHRSASSGRGSVEDGEEEVDVEIRMINEGNYLTPDGGVGGGGATGFAPDEVDKGSDEEEGSVQNTEDYLARLGIDVRKPPNLGGGSAVGDRLSQIGGGGAASAGGGYDNYGAGGGGSSIYNRIPDDTLSEKNSVLSGSKARGAGGGGGSLLYGSHHHHHHHHGGGPPSVAGSLSSMVHSEEELAGTYNWDYLLDWGPQYQPLAHVFKEISKLKDDGPGGGAPVTAVSVNASQPLSPPTLRNMPHTSHLFPGGGGARALGRSPISHEAGGVGGVGSLGGAGALSPSFHPALSPLATKSPSVSPLAVPIQQGRTAGGITKRL